MTDEQKQIINKWIGDARTLLHCHLSMARSLEKKHRNIGIIPAVFSAVVGSKWNEVKSVSPPISSATVRKFRKLSKGQ